MSTTFLLSMSSTLGWIGALGTVAAYALVSQRVLTATSRTFQAVNATGAALLTVSALTHHSWPSAASNVVWVVIAVVALLRARQARPAVTAAPLDPCEPAPAEAAPEPVALAA